MVAEKSDATQADCEIVITRLIDAPRELVWKVWTEPDHVINWWGPTGFSTTTHSMEVKPGGMWRYVMHGPDGRDYQNLITYLEVREPERLVYKHGGGEETEPVNFQMTVTFEVAGPSGEQTQVTMRSVFPSRKARDFVIREYNAVEGGKQHLGRLAEYVRPLVASGGAPGSSQRPFVITRVLAAPLELAWRAWTEREHLSRWFGPKGVSITQSTLELRPGGLFHFAMRQPDGSLVWGKWVFREIVPQERLEFISSFSDEKQGTTRHPFNGEWPLETLSTVTFANHAGIGHGTVVTVTWLPINASEAERQAFAAGHESMTQGWSGTFEQLREYIATVK